MSDSVVTNSGSGGPVLSYQECADELGIHRTTFFRSVLPHLEIVEISPRRRGVTRAVLDEYKRRQSRPPARVA